MSHHYDTDAARNDPRLNICDVWVFTGSPGMTTMVLTVAGDAGLSSDDTFHPEAIYSFRMDTDGDDLEDFVYKVRFGEPRDADAGGKSHVQTITVVRATGEQPGLEGEVIFEGETGQILSNDAGQLFAGLAADTWAADVSTFQKQVLSLLRQHVYDPDIFVGDTNTFANRNVMAIALEVPTKSFNTAKIGLWANISMFGSTPEAQVYRFGVPLYTHLLLSAIDAALVEEYHVTTPNGDRERFGPVVAELIARYHQDAGSAGDATTRGQEVMEALTPSMIHYTLGTEASFTPAELNGRPLAADAHETVWTLATGQLADDGLGPDQARLRRDFPYIGEPYSASEQEGLTPIKDQFAYEH